MNCVTNHGATSLFAGRLARFCMWRFQNTVWLWVIRQTRKSTIKTNNETTTVLRILKLFLKWTTERIMVKSVVCGMHLNLQRYIRVAGLPSNWLSDTTATIPIYTVRWSEWGLNQGNVAHLLMRNAKPLARPVNEHIRIQMYSLRNNDLYAGCGQNVLKLNVQSSDNTFLRRSGRNIANPSRQIRQAEREYLEALYPCSSEGNGVGVQSNNFCTEHR